MDGRQNLTEERKSGEWKEEVGSRDPFSGVFSEASPDFIGVGKHSAGCDVGGVEKIGAEPFRPKSTRELDAVVTGSVHRTVASDCAVACAARDKKLTTTG